jgi:predicted nucleic-acid-binding Zn-ribbon protein
MGYLWSEDKERDMLIDSMFATISCKQCGYVEKFVFRGSSNKCPKCGVRPLGVSEFNQRNAIVADATERFALQLFQSIVNSSDALKGRFFVKRNVECAQLELRNRTKADLAILDRDVDGPVTPKWIKCIFEVKMSIIWNWSETDRRQPLADYDSHAGRPSIYRTDSILKAIGKAAITRACKGSERIPFVVIRLMAP